jgi:hypothetical protein
MRPRDLRTRELDGESRESPAQPETPTTRPTTVPGAIAALVVVALIAAVFISLSARRPGHGATGNVATDTPEVALSPTAAALALTHGKGLPEGVEVIAFTLTGPDEGWGTGGVITNPVDGVPDRGMVLHYAGGSWTQVGPALPGTYLGGIDMLSSSEGWVIGGDSSGQSMLLHISNGAWQKEPLPAIDAQGAPDIMAMRTADEGWLAVANPKGAQGGANTSLLHYAGGVWSLIRETPHFITDIAPVADGEAWVIGWNADGTSSLVHVQGGVATVELTSPANSTFSHLRMFAPNDIWIEGVMHAATNADIDDVPLNYHYDGAAWSNVNLQVPQDAQHVTIAASGTAWSLASKQLPPPNETSYGQIATIYSNASGQWQKLSLPYKDLQSIQVVSASSADIWAIGVYMVTTQLPDHNGAQSFASISHYVLLRYSGGAWTEWGR